MKEALIDTDILSYFLKGNIKVVDKFKEYLKKWGSFNIAIISYYEIISGFEKKAAYTQKTEFEELISAQNIFNLTIETVKTSAQVFGDLKRKGIEIGNSDLLIAGIAMTHDLIMVTNNEKHFTQIPKLQVENWAK